MVPSIGNITINEEVTSSNNGDLFSLWNNKVPSQATAVKADKVGSLSFNVISTTPIMQSSDASKQVEYSSTFPTEQKPVAKKPITRTKVPFEKGYSQMDWLKLTRTHPDLAGVLQFLFLRSIVYIFFCFRHLRVNLCSLLDLYL